VRLRAALQNSYNVPAVRVAEALGTDAVLRVLRGAGFASLTASADVYGAGLVLGNGDVTLRELARAYRGLARGGVMEPVVEVRRASDAAGRFLAPAPELAPRRFLPASAVVLLTDVLSDEPARAPAFGLQNALRLPFPVAAKTGTSRAYVDNWTAGFTAERTVAVWVGSFDGRPMHGVSGITGAGPIFARVMVRAMAGISPAPLLDRRRLAHAAICPLSGKRAGPHCPAALDEVFLPGTEPRDRCDLHRPGAPGEPALALPPEHLAWARAEGIEARPAPRGGGARILLPGDGDEYLVEAGYPDGAQAVPVRVALPQGARAEVRLDGEPLVLDPPDASRVVARQGVHRLEIWLPGAPSPAATARFTVRGGGG
jgi:penicillin-binding protein 1C